jgi:flavin-binding protein dodecin
MAGDGTTATVLAQALVGGSEGRPADIPHQGLPLPRESATRHTAVRVRPRDRLECTTMDWSTTSDERSVMSVYRVIDVIGTSPSSWEEAAADAISTAGGSLRDLRVAEVTKQDVIVGDDGGLVFRTKIQLSFKYEAETTG